MTKKDEAAKTLAQSEGDPSPEVKKKAYVELGFTAAPTGQRYTGGSW